MKNYEQQEKPSVQMWDSETKTFSKWYHGNCPHCGTKVDRNTGECPEYKCWI